MSWMKWKETTMANKVNCSDCDCCSNMVCDYCYNNKITVISHICVNGYSEYLGEDGLDETEGSYL